MAALRQRVETEGDYRSMGQSFEEGARQIVEQVQKAYPLEGAHRQDLELRAFQLANQHGLSVRATARSRVIDAARGRLVETEDRLLSAIETERDPQRRQFLRDLFLDNVDQLQDANLLTAEDAAKRKLSFSDRADEVVKTGLFEQRAATLTADLMGGTNDDGSPFTKSQRVEAARRIGDSELAEEVVRRVKLQSDEQLAAQTAIARESTETAWDGLIGGRQLHEVMAPEIPAPDRKLLRTYEERRARAAADGGAYVIETDRGLYMSLARMRDSDRTEFAKVNLPQYRLRLSPADYDRLRGWQGAARKTGKEFEIQSSPLSGAQSRARYLIEKAEIPEDQHDEVFYRIEDAAIRATADAERNLTLPEIDSIVTEQLEAVTVPDAGWFWFDGEKRLVELTAEDRVAILRDPPDDWRDRARRSLQAAGIARPTGADLLEYMADLMDAAGVPRGE
ncbi:MAG: hypothetical protein KC616_23175 [Myxococcales bacterium]|nr:hypothetical protein [Myxococcales bacterium]